MTLHTTMPLELVLDGVWNDPPATVEATIGGVTMQLQPIGPGIGTIVRLIDAPLDCYLRSEFAPGRTIGYVPGGTGTP
ncbi:YlzJ-like family protein [Cohnella soli]|uniref:YlzJ-like family protein n=1 Tax=Cohnella soli TaxID=425005 RepID=A0ABW0HQ58_9BACL